jgi:UDP-2,3-diacylglucosamine hydrolase
MAHSETRSPLHTATPDAPDGRTVLFFADSHLCTDDSSADRARQEHVNRFLQSIDPKGSVLYIVGDLFDFWFGYRHAIPRRGFTVLATLAALRSAGLPITFIGGNHDFWALPFLRDELDIETSDGPLTRTLHGRRFLIAHGDGLGSGDHGYKALKRLFRNPLAIALYRLIHPDLGVPLATSWSRLSRSQSESDESAHADRLVEEVARPALAGDADVVVFGHVHHPTLRQIGTGVAVVLGDWIRHFTYLRLERGRLELLRFADDGSSHLVAAETPPGT